MASPEISEYPNSCSASLPFGIEPDTERLMEPQGPALDESALLDLSCERGFLSAERVAEALLSHGNLLQSDEDARWSLNYFQFLQNQIPDIRKGKLNEFLKSVFRYIAEVEQRPEYSRTLLELVRESEYEWVGGHVISAAEAALFSDPPNEFLDEFIQQVVFFLCDEGLRFKHEQETPKLILEDHEIFSKLSKFLLMVQAPDRALSSVISTAERDYGEQCDALLTSFFSDLCRFCIKETARSMKGMINERRKEAVHRLILVLKCICLRCSMKRSILREITDAIAEDDPQLLVYRDEFTQLMTRSEKKEFCADLEKREKHGKLASQTGAKLEQLVWKDEPDSDEDL